MFQSETKRVKKKLKDKDSQRCHRCLTDVSENEFQNNMKSLAHFAEGRVHMPTLLTVLPSPSYSVESDVLEICYFMLDIQLQ